MWLPASVEPYGGRRSRSSSSGPAPAAMISDPTVRRPARDAPSTGRSARSSLCHLARVSAGWRGASHAVTRSPGRQVTRAVYRDGVLVPDEPLSLAEGASVRFTLAPAPAPGSPQQATAPPSPRERGRGLDRLTPNGKLALGIAAATLLAVATMALLRRADPSGLVLVWSVAEAMRSLVSERLELLVGGVASARRGGGRRPAGGAPASWDPRRAGRAGARHRVSAPRRSRCASA